MYTYNEMLLSHKKNEIRPFIATGTDLEITILREVSQTEKDKSRMMSLTSGIQKKKKRYKWTYLQNRNRPINIENKFMVTKRELGRGEINQEFGINIYTLQKITNKDLLYSTGNYTHYFIITYKRKDSEKNIYI